MRLGLRWLTIGTGLMTFAWLGVEDTSTLPVAALGVLIALCGVLLWASAQPDFPPTPLTLSLTGGLIGALGALTTTLLMFVKTAWHSHIAPDYPALMMLAMLERAPSWGAAGVCVGLALALLWPLGDAKRKVEPVIAAQQRPDHDNGV
ncbi:hypothetical protein VZO05_02280 [Aggregatilineales bacterium SYSU G02658]